MEDEVIVVEGDWGGRRMRGAMIKAGSSQSSLVYVVRRSVLLRDDDDYHCFAEIC